MKTINLLLLTTIVTVLLFGTGLVLEQVLKMYQNNELKNNLNALELLKDEAKRGNTNAAFLLASGYRSGKVGVVNVNKAIYWYKVSANRGDGDAMLMLGWLYYKEPRALEVNLKKARYWFKQAALKGVDEAVEMLELLR